VGFYALSEGIGQTRVNEGFQQRGIKHGIHLKKVSQERYGKATERVRRIGADVFQPAHDGVEVCNADHRDFINYNYLARSEAQLEFRDVFATEFFKMVTTFHLYHEFTVVGGATQRLCCRSGRSHELEPLRAKLMDEPLNDGRLSQPTTSMYKDLKWSRARFQRWVRVVRVFATTYWKTI